MYYISTQQQFDEKTKKLQFKLRLVGFVAVAVATDGAQRGVKDGLFVPVQKKIFTMSSPSENWLLDFICRSQEYFFYWPGN